MEMYVGLTDFEWYTFQMNKKYDELNFWRPGTTSFKALQPNDIFLFKLKKPYYAIVGGGYFVGYSQLPCDVVWEMFGSKNGTENEQVFYKRVLDYKRKNNMNLNNLNIGSIVLTEPFFFEQKDWIKPMNDWSDSIVQGKKYNINIGEGKRVYEEVLARIYNHNTVSTDNNHVVADRMVKYYEAMTKHRIGQGAFRVIVTNAYLRKCAITGEKVLPVLQAAHIKAFSEGGPNDLNNGMLLRSDVHTLFDKGYITIDTDYYVDISKHLKEEFGESESYDRYHGKRIENLPVRKEDYPLKEYLQWHNDNVFKG
ncbi:MAG: HNH endonuclease [Bacillota bacterium]|nr:HNH endonuclease [Bacillota bacterium]